VTLLTYGDVHALAKSHKTYFSLISNDFFFFYGHLLRCVRFI